MHKLIHVHVEGPGFFEEEYYELPAHWDSLTREQQDDLCTNMAVDIQNNIASCGGSVKEVSDEKLSRLRRDRLVNEY